MPSRPLTYRYDIGYYNFLTFCSAYLSIMKTGPQKINSVSDLYETILHFYSELRSCDLAIVSPAFMEQILQNIRALLRATFPPEWINEVFKRLKEQSLIEDFRRLFQRLESQVEMTLAHTVVG